jgi:hypothetical protein
MVVVVVSGCGGSGVTSDVVTAPEMVGFGADVSTDDPHAPTAAARTNVVTTRTIIAQV